MAMFRIATCTRRAGAASTARGTEMPPNWSRVTSSLGAAFSTARTSSWIGFSLVFLASSAKASRTTRSAFDFLPVKLPPFIRWFARRSTRCMWLFMNGRPESRPSECGT